MLQLSHPRSAPAWLVGTFLFVALAGFAADTTARPAIEDAEANLQKTTLGYKVGDPARYLSLFGRLPTEQATLSPDGRHLAYTVLVGDELFLHVVDVDRPEALKTRALIRKIEYDPRINWDFNSRLVDWFQWVTPNRLVIAGLGGSRGISVVTAIDADGSNDRTLRDVDFREFADAKVKGAKSLRVVGIRPTHPDCLVLVADFTYQMRGKVGLRIAYSFNFYTGELAKLSETLVDLDSRVMVDRLGRPRLAYTNWANAADFSATVVDLPPARSQEPVPLSEIAGIPGFKFSTLTALREGSVPLGFDTTGDILYYASNIGRDTSGIYAVDLKTKERQPGALESPTADLLCPQMGTLTGIGVFDFRGYSSDSFADSMFGGQWRHSPQLVMDRFTGKLAGVRYEAATRTAVWYRPELQGIQEWLAVNRPGGSAEIIEWDESLCRFLIREQGPADPGAFFILDRKRSTYTQFIRRGPEPEAGSVAVLKPFDFRLPDGSTITGMIALPKNSKVQRVPLVLLCPQLPWERRGTSYQTEFEAFCRMGFAVAIYNGRGVWGEGIRERRKLAGDYVGVQVADVVSVADHLAEKFAVSRKAVALYGRNQGAFVALRALQLHPDRFRCAVTVDAWLHANAFLDAMVRGQPLHGSLQAATHPLATPLTEKPELIRSPVFTITEFNAGARYHANIALNRAVRKQAPESELLVQYDGAGLTPKGLARQWARTESFLNYVLYNFSVNVRELEVLPDEKAQPVPAAAARPEK